MYLLEQERHRIETVRYVADLSGSVRFQVKLNYNIRSRYDARGVEIAAGEPRLGDCLRLTLDSGLSQTVPVTGQANLLSLFVPEPQLWYPLGYGVQPLYGYTVELLRDGRVADSRQGRLAFRQIELLQRPLDEKRIPGQWPTDLRQGQ